MLHISLLIQDIQIGKGKARNKRSVDMNINGVKTRAVYQIVPCKGIKQCSGDSCEYIIPSWEVKRCSQHPSLPLKRTEDCPVEFVYIQPEDSTDNRRWITGITRCSDMKPDFLHNHPLHTAAKIPEKVKADIQKAVLKNPSLKTKDIIEG